MARILGILVTSLAVLVAGCASSPATSSDTVPPAQAAATGSDLQGQLHSFYADQPYLDAGMSTSPVPGGTPAHEWRTLPDGRLDYLHWNHDDPSKATKLLFVGDATGLLMGCLGTGGITQAQIDAGYNHFHRQHAASFAAGHHMDPMNPEAPGYWLRHLNADDGTIFKGLDSTNLGAANPLKPCPAGAAEPAETSSSTLHTQLHGFFKDQPYLAAGASTSPVPGGTPAHEWRTLPDGRLEYLHWNHDDPSKATKLLFVGDAVGPLMGCLGTGGITQAQIDQGYNHFHKLHAASFAAGHHMDPNDAHATGYWLRHLNADDGTVFKGLDSTNLGSANPLKAC